MVVSVQESPRVRQLLYQYCWTMDLGSIEDLLRPASLIERKQRLGLLNDVTPSSSPSKSLAAGTINRTSTATSTASNCVSTAAKSSEFFLTSFKS